MTISRHTRRIEGFAIVSEDGMLADAARKMDALMFPADQRFFESGLDAVGVVVHGRHSQERQPRSHLRHRLVLTRTVAAIGAHPTNQKALFWNPAGASFDEALTALGKADADVAVIGGADVFELFLDSYDVFHLTRAPSVLMPGGYPVFHGVPASTPEAILSHHGMHPGDPRLLDQENRVSLVSWHRAT